MLSILLFFLSFSAVFVTVTIVIKLKLSHYTSLRCLGEKYSSYSFLISALDGAERSGSHPGHALAPGKDLRYPLYRRLGGPQSRSEHRG
jgi:hypothetical protein